MNNLARLIESGLAVDGWYTRPDQEGKSDVHLSLAFSDGVFGGRPEDKVSFKMQLKRAEVRILLSDDVRLVRSSVADGTRPDATEVEVRQLQSRNEAGGVAVSGTGGSLSASVELGEEAEVVERRREEDINVLSKPSGGVACWEITSRWGNTTLRGSPWPSSEKRAQVVFGNTERHADASVRVVISCREEDLHIWDVTRTDLAMAAADKLLPYDRKMLAAKQLIKKRLMETHLTASIPDDRHAEVHVADVVIVVE